MKIRNCFTTGAPTRVGKVQQLSIGGSTMEVDGQITGAEIVGWINAVLDAGGHGRLKISDAGIRLEDLRRKMSSIVRDIGPRGKSELSIKQRGKVRQPAPMTHRRARELAKELVGRKPKGK